MTCFQLNVKLSDLRWINIHTCVRAPPPPLLCRLLVCQCFCFPCLSPPPCHPQLLVEHGYNCQRRTAARFRSVPAGERPCQRNGRQQAVPEREPFSDGQHSQQQGQVHHHQQSRPRGHHVSPSSNPRSCNWVLILFDQCGDRPLLPQPPGWNVCPCYHLICQSRLVKY